MPFFSRQSGFSQFLDMDRGQLNALALELDKRADRAAKHGNSAKAAELNDLRKDLDRAWHKKSS